MGGEDAIRNLFYTSSDPSVEFKMQLNVGAKGQVMPPGGGSAVVGWPILSGSSITFKGPDGIVTQPIQPGSGQSLVDGPGCLFGIGAQGPSIGGGSLYISSPCTDGKPGIFINIAPNGLNITGVSCTPWPPGAG